MSMEVNRQELKARARERLRASHPAFWKITLVYLLLTSGVTAVADLAGAARIGLPPLHLDTFALFLSLLVILYTTVMHLGYQWWALRTYRQQPTGYGALIDGFSMLPTLMEAGTDLAQLLVTPSLALPWTAVLLSSLIQLPLSLWLTPYQTVTFSGFYQARVMQSTQVPPVWERSDPYDVS